MSASSDRLYSDRQAAPQGLVNLKLSFVGANPEPEFRPVGRSDTKVSYLLGADRQSWRSDVPVWTGVRYEEIYPGLDL